jgi:hypothetical protein
MRVTKVQHFSPEELIKRLRKVTMLKRPDVYPYKDSFISLERVSTNYLSTSQYYILVDELKKVRDLKWALQEHGIDIFNLKGYIKFWLEGRDFPMDLLPPVVEESIESDGSVINIVADGLHRIYMARLEGIIPQVVFIRGIPKDFPYYAYPIAEGWNKIVIVEDLPEGFLKKWHRVENYESLYRNFNSAFDNVGAPRGFFKKERAS